MMGNNTNSTNDNKFRQITGIIVGCGIRGQKYAEYARHFPERFRLTAIADPRLVIREKLQKTYSIDEKYVFEDWRQLAATNVERLADCALITLPDQEHHQAAVQLAGKGYHILLEKPMATELEHCKEIVQVCEDNKVLLAVCHVLRYLPVVKKIKQLIDDNVIGKLVSIQHMEAIGKCLLFMKGFILSFFYRFLAFCSFIRTWKLA
jgi:predicted dehydrogenase